MTDERAKVNQVRIDDTERQLLETLAKQLGFKSITAANRYLIRRYTTAAMAEMPALPTLQAERP